MPREINRLSARFVATVTKPGRHSDGNRLYLRVAPGGSKQWILVYRQDGRWREMGLGGVADVSLKQARELADRYRPIIAQGGDAHAVRRAERNVAPTFGDLADDVLDSLKAGFRNEKHIAQWEMTLKDYAAPIRDLRVDAITTEDVLRVLRPIWTTKMETAARLRGRIEKIIDAAIAKGFRSAANPARWRGHLSTLLPKRQKLTRGHHQAMAFADLPAFMGRLRGLSSISARALEFTILTAARTGETIGALWPEIDVEAKVWTVPADRMKAQREHRVPLTDRAMEILREMEPLRRSDEKDGFIFPGSRRGQSLSSMALSMALRGLADDVTVHGFRSSFRDWAGDATRFPREIAEAALAHKVGDATEAAYRRGDALDRRRQLMTAWATFCSGESGKVVSIEQRAQKG
jgi:integrase